MRYVEGKEKTIFIDNVGLYNYFGLPDANRKWQHHFEGRAVPEEIKYEGTRLEGLDIPERTYDEDDETMMIVRGYGSLDDTNSTNEIIPEETFPLCDYYQIQGNEHHFTISTLVKKKGKATGEIGNIVYRYDKEQTTIVFSSNADKNAALLNCDSKLKSILLFSASLCNITQEELFKIDGINSEDGITLFTLLKILAQVYEIRKEDFE